MSVLRTPWDVHHVDTPEEYRAAQAAFLSRQRAASRGRITATPWTFVGAPPPVFISGGKWVLRCVCHNHPSVHPDWRLALCFECGAVYEAVTIPAEAADIEAVLARRASLGTRHWRPGVSIEDLDDENESHGLERVRARSKPREANEDRPPRREGR